ncbi:hypothetical protein [Specibacter sp. RAF43]|uniref:hypothetical protein n=1 Tax=Specibacter sp. RAF43 TaxID=3233057 RepID=UPI003F9D2BAF
MVENQHAKRVIGVLIVLDIIVVLFPTLHWSLTSGSPTMSVAYVLGSAVWVVLSLFVMAALDKKQKES